VAQLNSFKQLSDVSWEIPTSYKAGMIVPAKIYATRKLLEGMDSGVIEQVTNVACLPGIVRNAYAMADAHWGYGFPIGGVAAFDLETGVISPGGIGFDINCLHPDSRVYDENGVWRRIVDVDTSNQGFVTYDAVKKSTVATSAVAKQQRLETSHILRIATQGGKVLLATPDHPILTRRGMSPAGKISLDDELLTSGVEGIPFMQPIPLEVVSSDSLNLAMRRMGITDRGNARSQVLSELRNRSLDRLLLNDRRMPQILKILGFVFGAGTIPEVESGHYTTFYGKAEDLDEIKKDLQRLGFASHGFSRKRHHRIETAYGPSEFDFVEDSLQASSPSLSVLLVALGAPYGKKTNRAYRLPEWLTAAESWQKKLFVATFFGAELSKPMTTNGYDFQMPTFSVSKLETLSESGIELLEDFRNVLLSLGIETSPPVKVEGYNYEVVDGPSTGFRIGILSNTENLLKFLSRVGYLYNKEKQRLASLSACYLRHLQRIRDERDQIRNQAVQMYARGVPPRKIVESLASEVAGASFIRHSIWATRGSARVWKSERFEAFAKSREAGTSGLVFDKVRSIESVPYEGLVFDVTIGDANHNFISEGVVVSSAPIYASQRSNQRSESL
jgi:tRNA-splicing ligase RtcB